MLLKFNGNILNKVFEKDEMMHMYFIWISDLGKSFSNIFLCKSSDSKSSEDKHGFQFDTCDYFSVNELLFLSDYTKIFKFFF